MPDVTTCYKRLFHFVSSHFLVMYSMKAKTVGIISFIYFFLREYILLLAITYVKWVDIIIIKYTKSNKYTIFMIFSCNFLFFAFGGKEIVSFEHFSVWFFMITIQFEFNSLYSFKILK